MSRELRDLQQVFYDYVFAINSQGDDCGLNTPSTFTRISPYIKWIDSIIFGENGEMICFSTNSVQIGTIFVTF